MRPTNNQYFIEISKAVSLRATCRRRAVGCVITDRNHHIIATGYNSVPRNYPHCPDGEPCPGVGGMPGDSSKCIARHAEDIALTKCMDIYSIYTCYTNFSPCLGCVRRLLDTSCERIVYAEEYPDKKARILWESFNRKWEQV